MAKRTQEQLQEILKRKQSLSLNLKRSMPASPGRSSSSSDILSSRDLKSFQDACNRKLRIASALCLLPSDLPSSTDTTETFHTAAANSPELRSLFPETNRSIELTPEIKLSPIINENEKQDENVCNECKNQTTGEKTEVKHISPNKNSCIVTNNILPIEVNIKATDDYSANKSNLNHDEDEEDDTFGSHTRDSQETLAIGQEDEEMSTEDNEEMKRLNQMITRQRMVVMKCLEANTPAKDDLNKEIMKLQDLQRQQIELEVWLLKREKQYQLKKGTSKLLMMEPKIDYVETESEDDNHWNSQNSVVKPTNLPITSNRSSISGRDALSEPDDESQINRINPPKMPPTRGYSSVYLTVSYNIINLN